ncbi:hypothetical protein DSM112329_01093 [Paraconexibacter sp. AEG42_29]|uniref:ABC3 transporter permease C-terminal domain-containing protein n=1 Tax=Paraconexibacter sp. AEG42_29 TaxID=2997339 RepID=A0AAU7ARJ5_9ACTN
MSTSSSSRIDDLALGARMALAGGRSSRLRAAMTAIGVGLGVALLLAAASIPAMIAGSEDRGSARSTPFGGGPTKAGPGTLLIGGVDTTYRGDDLIGRDLQREGPRAPAPPGVRQLPAPGTMVVSPKLNDLLNSSQGRLLRERLDARVVGIIGDSGLRGPAELVFYRGTDRFGKLAGVSADRDVERIARFGDGQKAEPLGPLLSLIVAIAVIVLLLPVAVFVAAAVRFGGEDRDRRLAALRLVGADRATAARVAAGETLFGAVAGIGVGAALFFGLRPLVERFSIEDISVFAGDVRPSAVLTVLILVLVPLASVLVSLLALRRVVIEPLGVVRRAPDARRRLRWRVVPALIGLALLVPLRDGLSTTDGSDDQYQAAAGVFFGLIGITAVLPWLVEVVVRRMHGGSLSWQLATRRLQMDGGTAARVVSGIAVAVAGAIALQTLFTAAERESTRNVYYENGRPQLASPLQGQSTRDRAQVSANYFNAPDGTTPAGLVHELRSVPGVSGVIGTAQVTAQRRGHADDYLEIVAGDCRALREYGQVRTCQDGDVFIPPGFDSRVVARPGDRLIIGEGSRGRVRWTVPAGARKVGARTDPGGGQNDYLLVTPGALGSLRLPRPTIEAYAKTPPGDDTLELVRNAVARVDPSAYVTELTATRTAEAYTTVRRGVYASAVAVLLLIGASLLVGALEQLRERRRVLAVLVAFGTRRSTMATSVLWQALVPVTLGLLVAVAVGATLGALLLKMASEPVIYDWGTIAAMTGAGGAVVLLVTALSMPALWRLMRPDGLRTE